MMLCKNLFGMKTEKKDPTEISGVDPAWAMTQVVLGQHYHINLHNMSSCPHILVAGNSGSDDTRNVMVGALLQGNKSYIVNDMDGELYKLCGPALEKIGYKVYQINFDKSTESIPKVDYAELLSKKVAIFVKVKSGSTKLLARFYYESYREITAVRSEMVEYRIRMDKQNGVPDGTKWLLDGFPVMFLLNNFTDIGKIPAFHLILGTNRGHGIVYMIGLQSLSDLKRVYGDNWSNILNLCDTMIFTCNCDSEIYVLFAKHAALPLPQTPGNEVLLQNRKGWFCDKVFDVDKRLKELS